MRKAGLSDEEIAKAIKTPEIKLGDVKPLLVKDINESTRKLRIVGEHVKGAADLLGATVTAINPQIGAAYWLGTAGHEANKGNYISAALRSLGGYEAPCNKMLLNAKRIGLNILRAGSSKINGFANKYIISDVSSTPDDELAKRVKGAFESRFNKGGVKTLNSNDGKVIYLEKLPNTKERDIEFMYNVFKHENPTRTHNDILNELFNYYNGGGKHIMTPLSNGKELHEILTVPKLIEEIYPKPQTALLLIISHETNHVAYQPTTKAVGFTESMNPKEAPSILTEAKNFEGITEPNTALTEQQLQHFLDNYERETGISLDRYNFKKNLIDVKKAAEWSKDHALSFFAPTMLMKMLYGNKNNNMVSNKDLGNSN